MCVESYYRAMVVSEEHLHTLKTYVKEKYGNRMKLLIAEPYEWAHFSSEKEVIFSKAAARFQHLMRFER